MQQLLGQIEQLSSAIMAADACDLAGLADVHSRLERMVRLLEEMPQGTGAASSIRDDTDSTRKLVERLILNEVEDAEASFRQITQSISQLQQALRGVLEGQTSGQPISAPVPPACVSLPAPQVQPNRAASGPQPFNPDDLPLILEFVGEAGGHLETAEGDLLRLEEQPDDAEAIGSIFRAFHTIKGVAGFLNLEQIQSLAHAAENLLDRARQGQLQLTGPASDLVMQSIDRMKALVAELTNSAKAGQAPPVDPSARSLTGLLEKFIERAQADPAVAAGQAPPAPSARVPAADTDADDAAETEAKAAGDKPAHAAGAEMTVKVATDRLDALINMVGELVIAQSMVGQDIQQIARDNPRLARNSAHLGKITRELQDLSMSLRMVPLAGVFRKMARVVRDVSRKAGKQVELIQTGGETELDRNVVEQIADPLVHMVRNSVDHGVEPPEVRAQSGKTPQGRIELKAYHQAGNITIEVIDDGKGINRKRVLEKALAAGLVKPGEQLTDPEVFKLIFHPGLSTAEKVTDISGRGVGMDVVKRNIEALRGRVDIASAEGKGSVFTIRLPLTLAVIDGLIVKVGSQKYILPIPSIEQSLRPTAEQLSTVQGRGELCLVRGALLPIIRLHRLFNVAPASEDPTRALVVIVQDNDRRVCLLVDELLGQEQVVIKSLGDNMDQVRGVSGGAVLGDGNVSLILDVPGLVEMAVD